MAGRGTDIKLGPGVAALGGLYVMATEPHAARRIDRQLFGRCSRQGDPGTCELFASREDEVLVHLRGIGKLLLMATRAAVRRRPEHWFSQWLLKSAQKSIERRHYQVRAELLRFDEMMEQTLAFSGQRE